MVSFSSSDSLPRAKPGEPRRAPWLFRRRVALALGTVASAILLGAAVAPWTVSRNALREDVAGQLRSATGLYVFNRGRTSLSILPRPRVHFTDVSFVDPKGSLVVDSPSLAGDIRFLPLLAGRLEVAQISLESPRITVDLDREPLTTAGAALRAAQAPPGTALAAKTDAARLGVLVLSNASAVLRRAGVPVASLAQVNARLDWRNVASPASLTADLEWHGVRQQLSVWIAKPASLLRRDSSPVTAQIRNPHGTASVALFADLAREPQFQGRLQIATTSIPDASAAIGHPVHVPPGLSALALEGDFSATPDDMSVGNARLTLGPDQFEGALALHFPTRSAPALSGTLATSSLTLDPYVKAFGDASSPQAAAFPFAQMDLDLRLSAAHMRLRRLQAEEAAFSISAKDGTLELSLADARAYKGSVKARCTVGTMSSGRYDLNSTLAARGLDWGALDRDLGGQQRVAGAADLSLSVQGTGASLPDVLETLRGQARLTLTDGEIGGLDVPGTLSRLDRRPLAAASDLRSGRTPFETANLPLEIEAGRVQVSAGSINGPGYAMSVSGSAQIKGGEAALKAAVRPAGAEAAESAAFVLDVVGPWKALRFVPDVQSFLRRSGAASPLFGATGHIDSPETRSN